MGCKELIGSLRTAGDERLRTLRADAEQEADRVRAEASRRIDALHEEHARRHAVQAALATEALLAEANAAVRTIRIRAERDLADRLYGVARASLPHLRNAGYRDVFAGFARELPKLAWRTVQVNPADVELAREVFPDADVRPDPAIIGGMVAAAENDRMQVVNTFEKRLACLWEEMLPDIMKELAEGP